MLSDGRKTFVCKRLRLASYLMGCGFQPYRVTADKNNPVYNVYLFDGTPEVYAAVTRFFIDFKKEGRTGNDAGEKSI